MNLADAIRKAAQFQPHPVVQAIPVAVSMPIETKPEPSFAVPTYVVPVIEPEPIAPTLKLEEATVTPEPAAKPTFDASAPAEHSGPAGSVVRLELFLTPEQLSNLFRAVAANQHSMMTLREAASLLRVPAHSLEQMATEGDIPGFLIDGRWRFSKSAIEEWLNQRQPRKETA